MHGAAAVLCGSAGLSIGNGAQQHLHLLTIVTVCSLLLCAREQQVLHSQWHHVRAADMQAMLPALTDRLEHDLHALEQQWESTMSELQQLVDSADSMRQSITSTSIGSSCDAAHNGAAAVSLAEEGLQLQAAVAQLDALYAAQVDVLQVQMQLAAADARIAALLKVVLRMHCRSAHQAGPTEDQISEYAAAAARHKRTAELVAKHHAAAVAQRASSVEAVDFLAAALAAPQKQQEL
jgi:hypothetical protein